MRWFVCAWKLAESSLVERTRARDVFGIGEMNKEDIGATGVVGVYLINKCAVVIGFYDFWSKMAFNTENSF